MGLISRAIDRGLGIGAADISTPIGIGSAAYGQIERAASLAGLPVSPETALRTSTAWACVRLISETVAMLPLQVYQRQADGGRRAATNHPLYELLHDAPNATAMTAMQFRQMLTLGMLLRGNGYAKIEPGARGYVDQLVPLIPEQVSVQRNLDWTLTYRVYDPRTRQTTPYQEDEIFHVAGLSLDGQIGMSVLAYAANSLGLALSAESFASRFFSNDARPVGALKSDKELSQAAQERLRENWDSIYGHGLANSGKVAILEDGLSYEMLSFNPEDSQLLEMRHFSVADVARWWNVPLHMLQSESKDTSWGSGIEQLAIGFVTWTILPWLKRWEQAINRRLILAPQTFYAEHEVAMLLRGDQKTRFDSYWVARQAGWMSANDVRMLENMTPIGPEGDIYLQPSNMVEAGSPPEPSAPPVPLAPSQAVRETLVETQARVLRENAADDRAAQLGLVARAAAERALRKEQAAVARLERRHVGDPEGMKAAVDAFYGQHADWVAGVLGVDAARTQAWARDRRADVLALGAAAFGNAAQAAALDDLTALALADATAAAADAPYRVRERVPSGRN